MDVLSFSIIADHIKKEINDKCGLNLSQTRILLFFDKNSNEKLTMGKLAQGLRISLSTLSRQLQQKKTQAFVKITRSEKDSSKNVQLNQEGLEKVHELKETLSEIESSLASSIDSQQLDSFSQELNILSKEYAETEPA